MTRQRAISHLNDMLMWGIVQADEYNALKMAIKALEQESKTDELVGNSEELGTIKKTLAIPENATNEDMIKTMFPSCKQKEHINNNGYFEIYFDNDLRNASYMRVSKDWWNAPYKSEVRE